MAMSRTAMKLAMMILKDPKRRAAVLAAVTAAAAKLRAKRRK